MIDNIVARYLEIFPEESNDLTLLQDQIKNKEDLTSRKNFRWHVTASWLVFWPDKKEVYLIHHKALDKYLQPGGHMEPEDQGNPWDTAEREVREEAQLEAQIIAIFGDVNIPLDIDTHLIPANEKKQEPEHFHHDFMYIFQASSKKTSLQLEEVLGGEWMPVDNLPSRFNEALRKLKFYNKP